MGDREDVQMDNTPVFPAARGPTVRRRRQANTNGDRSEEIVGEQGEVPVKAGMPTYVRVILLLSLIPIMYYVPKVLSMTGEKVQKNQHLLIYLWGVYVAVLLSIFFFFKRKTITLDSFATQIMAWLIFSLGIYHLVDLPKMVEMKLRKDVLYVWCSFTMIFNLVYFFIDTTDHQAAERKEKVKEEKRQKKEDERKKKKEEKRKEKLAKMMSPRTRLLVNSLIYIFMVLGLMYSAKWTYDYYQVLQVELAGNTNDPNSFNADFEDKITDPVAGEDY